jgi:glutaredoxin
MKMRALIVVFAVMAASAGAQELYRWTDERGRVHITDTPPPPSATNVELKRAAAVSAVESQPPYELTQAMRDFPVTLYTSPNCDEPCSAARELLNRRAIPFKEVQVADEASSAELLRISGAEQAPTLVVGRSVQRGYAQAAYEELLDAARYPRAGLLPPRAQTAPGETEPPAPSGPYAPRPQR